MQFRQLRYFVKIVEAGSFSRAAAVLHISQPALSKRIAELEDEFGIGLLTRSPRGVRPTPAGGVLYDEAVKLVRHVDDLPSLLRNHHEEVQGMVCFGMSSTVAPTITGKLVEQCKAAFPKVTLRFVIADSNALREKVTARGIELALVFEDHPVAGFTREVLFRQRLCLAGRPDAGVEQYASLAAAAELPMMLPSPQNVLREAVERRLAAGGLSMQPIAESDIFDVHIASVESGLCYSILPHVNFARVMGHPDIATVALEPPIFITACLVAHRESTLTPAAAAVGAAVRALVRSRPPDLEGAEWPDEA